MLLNQSVAPEGYCGVKGAWQNMNDSKQTKVGKRGLPTDENEMIGEQNMRDTFRIEVVTNQLHDVTGEAVLAPERATLLGAVKVIPQELANLTTRNIDVELPQYGSHAEERLLDQLLL